MEKLAHELADQMAAQFGYDEDKKAVVAYGLIALIQTVALLIIISFIGVLFRFFYESLVIFLGVGFIKKSTGGAHSETMFGCMIISVFSIVILSVFARYVFSFHAGLGVNILISAAIFTFCFLIFKKRVPVDSPNKPIVKPEKIKRLRIQSYVLLGGYTILSLVLIHFSYISPRFYSVAVSIRLALLWQTLMLTKPGINLLKRIDTKFSV